MKGYVAKKSTARSTPIVCIGASAGGLEALIPLFKSLPGYLNMAFVVVQHLEPTHKSILVDILTRGTSLHVQEAKNNVTVRPGNIYVIPPNSYLSISRGKLKVTPRARHRDGRYLPIDFFMASLAADSGRNAVGIVLSGTGMDGACGSKAIKDGGGITFAQDQKTAKYYDMPAAAIAGGAVDFVLAPAEISRKLIELAERKHLGAAEKVDGAIHKEDALGRIILLLRDLTGVDFLHYKRASIERRIMRRSGFHNLKSCGDYYAYLKKNPAEAKSLYKDILIPVTMFFRDPGIFTALRKKILPRFIKNRPPKDLIRVWVPACSTGEEAYSIAMTIYEFLEESGREPCFQVFGTDLSESAIEKARAAAYGEDISARVSAVRLRRFFTRTETGYKIAKHLRDMCVFAKQDVANDTPLSNMDIISCRNLLIYLDAFLQNKVLSVLQYALKPRGFLILGTAESITSVEDLFTVINKKLKIYTKNITARRLVMGGIPDAGRRRRTCDAGAGVGEKAVAAEAGAARPCAYAPEARFAGYPKVKADKSGGKQVRNEPRGFTKLETELIGARNRLRAIIEEKDTLNEELKAANEEIQSSNEELQSTNEELETSKEELQSTNEELITVNEELQNKNAQLTQLNSDLANVLTSVNIPLIIVRNDLRIMRFNPMARKVMNLIPSDIGRPVGDIKLNMDISDLEGMILGVIEDMAPREVEVKDKEGRWYSVRIRPYRTIDNRIDGAVIALIDIDSSKRGKEELQRISDYNQAIIETVREALVVMDKDLRILSANKSFYDIFRIKAPDVKDALFYELGGHPWKNPQLKRLLKEILHKKSRLNDFEASFDLPVIGPRIMAFNGRQISLRGKSSPLILLAIEDITKRKKAEDILKRDNRTLDKMINKRSKELLRLQMELVKSRHLSAIGTLAATVAHELRNPLTDIAVSVHRIKKISKEPRVARILADINTRILESDQIITNILMYSKTPITRYELVKINDIVRDSIEREVRKSLGKKVVIADKTGATKGLHIDADPVRIKEVFRNILHNSVEAVAPGTGRIEIGSEASSSVVTIFVRDNGAGIAKNDLRNIASPFFTTKEKGTGLGLMVCRQVIMLHGGSMAIKSAPGKGTTVTVTLPIHKPKNA